MPPLADSAAAALPRLRGRTPFEDAQAIFTGTLFVSLALILFNQVGLLTGGTAGAAFLLHYATGVSLGKLFFLINLPFYWFAWRRMGREFTLKTFVAISLLSALTEWSPQLFAIDRLHPAYAAVLGGLLLGSGSLFLARHRASLGGIADCRDGAHGAAWRRHRSFHMFNLHKHSLAAATALALGFGFAGLPAAVAQVAAPTTTPGLGPGPVAAASGGGGAMSGGAKLAGGDRTFVEKAAIGGMAEVALGKMAQEKGSSDAVKQFGAHMVADHTKANDELMQIASSKGVTPPADLDRKHKATSDKLSKLSGEQFDREYVKAMVADHKDTAKLMENESKSGKDADLKAFAAKTLPVVQEHLQTVVGMDKSMKK